MLNHVPQAYEGMGEVAPFVASFKEFPPRSTPQSFNPANMLDETLRGIKAKAKTEQVFPMLRPKQNESEDN